MGPLDLVFFLYFATHIPATIFVDSQSLVPASFYPQWCKDALAWHIKSNEDHLVRDNPAWFVSLVVCELLLQLPFFFVACYAIWHRRNWFRLPGLVYGVHVTTTLVPILGDILFGPNAGPKRFQLAAIYAPYLIVPLLLAIKMLASPVPWPEKQKRKKH